MLIRAGIYASKLLVGQQWNEKTDYNLINPVMSVWINTFKQSDLNYPIIRFTLKPEIIQSGIGRPFKVLGEVPDFKDFDLISIFMINLKAPPIDGTVDPMIEQLKHLVNGEFSDLEEFFKENDIKYSKRLVEEITVYSTLKDAVLQEGIEIGENKKAHEFYNRLIKEGFSEKKARELAYNQEEQVHSK